MLIVELVAGVLGALLAGVYLAFVLAVLPALRRLDDRTVIVTMQAINRAIVGPAFVLLFLGAPVGAVATAVVAVVTATPIGAITAAVLGAVLQSASLLVTLVLNTPRNTALDRADADDPDSAARARLAFERPWTRAHAARTALTTLGALALLV